MPALKQLEDLGETYRDFLAKRAAAVRAVAELCISRQEMDDARMAFAETLHRQPEDIVTSVRKLAAQGADTDCLRAWVPGAVNPFTMLGAVQTHAYDEANPGLAISVDLLVGNTRTIVKAGK